MTVAVHNVSFSLRRAVSSDAEDAAPLIFSSGPAAFEFAFSGASQDALSLVERAFTGEEGLLSHRNHVVADVRGHAVGTIASYTGADLPSLGAGGLRSLARTYGALGAWKALRRGMLLERMMPPPDTRSLYLAHVGVEPNFRRRGVASALVEERIEAARTVGFERVLLDVAVPNQPARILYEKLGFEVTGRRDFGRRRDGTLDPIAKDVAVPDHLRMQLDL